MIRFRSSQDHSGRWNGSGWRVVKWTRETKIGGYAGSRQETLVAWTWMWAVRPERSDMFRERNVCNVWSQDSLACDGLGSVRVKKSKWL